MLSAEEARVRALARRLDYRVYKSRQKYGDDLGEFQLVDDCNFVVLGERYEATLDEIERYLQHEKATRQSTPVTDDEAEAAIETLRKYLDNAGPSERQARKAEKVFSRFVRQLSGHLPGVRLS